MVAPNSVHYFIAPAVDVFAQEGEVLFVSSNVTLGSGLLAGAGGLNLSISYQDPASNLVNVTEFTGLSVTVGERNVFTLSATIPILETGFYTVGMAGSSIDPNWQGGYQSATSVLVLQPEDLL